MLCGSLLLMKRDGPNADVSEDGVPPPSMLDQIKSWPAFIGYNMVRNFEPVLPRLR